MNNQNGDSNDIRSFPYSEWLENALGDMIRYPIKGIYIAAIGNDGSLYVNDYNITVTDKYIIAGNIQQDTMIDMLSANGYITRDDEQ